MNALKLLIVGLVLFSSVIATAQNSSVTPPNAKYNKAKSNLKKSFKKSKSKVKSIDKKTNKRAAEKKVDHQYKWGIGLRLGDPAGITAKKYLAKGRAIEIAFGATRLFQRNEYYNNRFNNWYKTKNFAYTDHQYVGYKASTPVGLQVHYTFHKPLLSRKVSGLTWYFGGGGMLAYRNYMYDYRYKLDSNAEWIYQMGEKTREVDFGISGVIGIEYTMENAPVSFFIDTALFMEIFNNPFAFNANGGLGARYNF